MKKLKFKSAEEKKQYLENQASWEKLKSKYQAVPIKQKSSALEYSLTPPPGREYNRLPSLSTSGNNSASLKSAQKYTGDKVLGVSIIHKSCLQPIFSQQEAVDVASMRR